MFCRHPARFFRANDFFRGISGPFGRIMLRMKRALRISYLLAGVAAVFAILLTLRLPSDTYLWREIHNAGHTPLFGVLSLLLLGILLFTLSDRTKPRLYCYIVASVAALLLGILLEVFQISGDGDADLVDILRDLAGIASFLLIFMVFDKKIIRDGGRGGRKGRMIVLIAAVFMLGGALTPTALWTAAYFYRDRNFPTLLNFESSWEMKFISTQNASLRAISPPSSWENKSRHVGQLAFSPGSYPGFAIVEPYPDWSGYRYLSIDIFSVLQTAISLTLRIDDVHHDREFDDRYNGGITIRPGVNHVRIPLEEIEYAPLSRRTDMKAIKQVMLFAGGTIESFDLYIDNFRLE